MALHGYSLMGSPSLKINHGVFPESNIHQVGYWHGCECSSVLSQLLLKTKGRPWFRPAGGGKKKGTGIQRMRASAENDGACKPVIPIMVNDCRGKMGQAVAEAAVDAGLQLVPFSLTGDGRRRVTVSVRGIEIDVQEATQRESVMDRVLQLYPDVIIVDYTLPDAVNENAEFYCARGVPFVMGTTGGDRSKLMNVVQRSGVYAVIAPQMGKQVVAFQANLESLAEQFPGAFAGYSLQVTESHQSTKQDTSGTAKAVVSSFQKLGLQYNLDQIEMVRDPDEQVSRMGVPPEHLNGHAFHTYRVVSQDGNVVFQFQHNVCGRTIYTQGTVDAVLFLAKKIREGSTKKLYNMIDVLREGNMR